LPVSKVHIPKGEKLITDDIENLLKERLIEEKLEIPGEELPKLNVGPSWEEANAESPDVEAPCKNSIVLYGPGLFTLLGKKSRNFVFQRNVAKNAVFVQIVALSIEKRMGPTEKRLLLITIRENVYKICVTI
jgi:hypothetical protein